MEKGLTEKQKIFCGCVARGREPTEAALEAGYADANTMGKKLLQKENIQKEIERLQKQETDTERDEIAGGEEILAFLTLIMRESNDTKLRMKAAELLGKRTNIFEKQRQEGENRIVIYNDIPDIPK